VPVIKVVKTCGLIPEGCTDVHARIGEIVHPTLKEHFINHIDFYLDKEFLARVHLTPEKLNPAGALHLKANSGKITVIELCNVHGAWIAEATL
jgi:superoxide reductase